MQNPQTVDNVMAALNFARDYGYPVQIDAEFTLECVGKKVAANPTELIHFVGIALELSPTCRVQLTYLGTAVGSL